MKFMMLMIPAVYHGNKKLDPNFPDPKMLEKMTKYNEELGKVFKITDLNGLHPLTTLRLIPATSVEESFRVDVLDLAFADGLRSGVVRELGPIFKLHLPVELRQRVDVGALRSFGRWLITPAWARTTCVRASSFRVTRTRHP
jgi:hypothetical protein